MLIRRCPDHHAPLVEDDRTGTLCCCVGRHPLGLDGCVGWEVYDTERDCIVWLVAGAHAEAVEGAARDSELLDPLRLSGRDADGMAAWVRLGRGPRRRLETPAQYAARHASELERHRLATRRSYRRRKHLDRRLRRAHDKAGRAEG